MGQKVSRGLQVRFMTIVIIMMQILTKICYWRDIYILILFHCIAKVLSGNPVNCSSSGKYLPIDIGFVILIANSWYHDLCFRRLKSNVYTTLFNNFVQSWQSWWTKGPTSIKTFINGLQNLKCRNSPCLHISIIFMHQSWLALMSWFSQRKFWYHPNVFQCVMRRKQCLVEKSNFGICIQEVIHQSY